MYRPLVIHISQHAILWGCTWSQGSVPGPRGCTWFGGLPGPGRGVPGPRGCTWSWGVYLVLGGVYLVQGGVPGPRGCTWLWGCTWSYGVYLVYDVPGPRGLYLVPRGCTWSRGYLVPRGPTQVLPL